MDLEKIIEIFVLNFKKYIYGIFSFILGLVLINYGIIKTMIVLVITIIGYKLGDKEFHDKLKKYIINRFKD